MIVLGIESTCDETAVAIVQDGKRIFSNVIATQADLHEQYGGVFPELACRRHIDTLIPVLKKSFVDSGIKKEDIGLIAVAKGPGLIGALLIGLNCAKALSAAWNKPFVGVNHVEAHLYAAMMPLETLSFPALGVVVSGGHTFLVRIEALGQYSMIGTTQDDAIGEVFDKVAAMLGLPYPGGPSIEKLAKKGNANRYPFKSGRVKESPWDFSFSGLKTNVLYTLKGPNADKLSPLLISEEDKADVAASFQEVALLDVVEKALKAANAFSVKSIFLGGGVSNNLRLRQLFEQKAQVPVYWPEFGMSLDNAAMIAGLGYHVYKRQGADTLDLSPMTRIPLG